MAKLGVALIAALSMLVPGAAWAHAGLVKSEPGRRAVLGSAPKQIRLCFNEKVEAKFSSVSLASAAGEAVALDPPATDAAEPQCLVTGIKGALLPGGYTVKYKVLSVDGHIVDYGFGFSIRTP